MKTMAGQRRRQTAAAVLTDGEVRAIRAADAVKLVSRLEQAQMYGVGKETIARICRRETYAWVPDEPEANPLVDEPTDQMTAEAREAFAKALALQRSLSPDQMLTDMDGEDK